MRYKCCTKDEIFKRSKNKKVNIFLECNECTKRKINFKTAFFKEKKC